MDRKLVDPVTISNGNDEVYQQGVKWLDDLAKRIGDDLEEGNDKAFIGATPSPYREARR